MDAFDLAVRAKFANVVRTREDMHGYQADEAVPFLKANPFSGLFIDMGLGKTISSLTVIADLIQELVEDGQILVVGPLKVACDTWPTEIGLWAHTAHLNWTLLREDEDDPRIRHARRRDREEAEAKKAWRRRLEAEGKDKKKVDSIIGPSHEARAREEIRGELAMSKATVHIINREQLEWLVNFHGRKWPYRTVFIDESSSFKDHNSNRFKALAKVRRTPGLIARLHILTATPAAETYEHLFAQIYLLDLGERFGKGITRFRETYFTYNRWSMKWKLRPGAEEEILKLIADITLVMKAKDYLNIEDPTIVTRPVKLDQADYALIEKMQRDFLVTLPDGTEVEAETAAALSAKLLQMASGVLYETARLKDWDTGDMTKVTRVHDIHDHKIVALKEVVEEVTLQGDTLLVAYHFKSSLARLKKAFPKAVVMDREGKCVKAWNAGSIPMLLIHPQSGGHGLNLQHGGHHLVFFDIPWSLELYLQLIGRLARQGQKHPVIVMLLVALGTLDEAVVASLQEKDDAQTKLFRLLKRLIRAHRKRKQLVEDTL